MNFLQTEIVYLGHKCPINGVEPDIRLVECVKKFPKPITVKHVQYILGLSNYYRKFIEGFARIAKPLYDLLQTHAE